jgi:hypothetical protein
MRWLALLGVVTAACGDSAPGPITGPEHLFIVDGVVVPMNNDEARAMACDLEGGRSADNQLGQVIATQAQENNITPYVAELIGSGVLTSFVSIQADDLGNDDRVGVRYLGGGLDAPSVLGVGFLDNGAFTPLRDEPGAGVVKLPVFLDADVATLQVNAMRVSLTPDGAGGFDALICGAIPEQEAMADAARALIQMIENNPADHPYVIGIFDANIDGVITTAEIMNNSLFRSFLGSDVKVRDVPHVSVGFRAHLTACPGGVCPAPPAGASTCHDRVLDGAETDIDCGGTNSCLRCAAGRACAVGEDCASGSCDLGVCRAPTCTDGVMDGFESDVDCGWNCGDCTSGQMCERASDCVSSTCNNKTCF